MWFLDETTPSDQQPEQYRMDLQDYRLILQNLSVGYAYHRLIVDDFGRPIDYEFIDVNLAFEEVTGLSRELLIGQRVTFAVSEVCESKFDWIGHFGKVALEGVASSIEQYFEPHGTLYSVYAYAPRRGYFVTIISKIGEEFAFQRMLAMQSTSLLSANEHNFASKVEQLLETLGPWFGAHRCYWLLVAPDRQTMAVKGQWCRHDVLPLPASWQRISLTDLRWWRWQLMSADQFIYDVNQLPVEAMAERALLNSALVNRWLIVPLQGPQRPDGFLALDCCDGENHWGKEQIAQLKIFATILSEVITKIRQNQELQASELKVRKITESMEEVFWLLSANGQNVLYISPSFAKVVGQSCLSLCQNPQLFLDAVYDDDLEMVLGIWKNSHRNEKSEVEFRICRPNGEIRWVRASCYLVKDQLGKTLYYTGIASDITGQKELQEQLTQTTEQFVTALAGSYDGIWGWDLRDNSAFFSDRYLKMIGHIPGDLDPCYETFLMLVHPEDRIRVEQYVDDYLEGKCEQFQIDFRFRHREGHYIWVMARGAGLKDAEGKIYRLSGSHTDITQRKETEERWSTYVAMAPYGILIADAMGKCLEVNPMVCRQTGFSQSELQKMSVEELTIPEVQEETQANFQRLRQNGFFEGTTIFLRKDGGRPCCFIVASKLTEDRYLVFIQDISKQQQAEQEKVQMQQQLLQAAKMASIGELAAGIGHEINNPLAIIDASVELLTCRCDISSDPTIAGHLEKIKNSVLRMQNIVNGLKMYARSEHVPGGQFDMHHLIHQTVILVAEIYRKNGVMIEVKFGAKNSWIDAQEGRIQQVLMNLLSNSVDAMAKRGGVIQINTFDDGNRFGLQLIDNGSGIAPEHISKIFDPFFSTKEVGKGVGIGLSISYQIIQEAHGTIHVESVLGKHTTFAITFPAVAGPNMAKSNVGPASLAATRSPLQGKVLVVDDEKDLRELLATLLRMLGVEVATAANGIMALELLSPSTRFDVVITDLKMPGMDGMTLIQRMKELDRPEKIVVMTGGIDLDGNSQEQQLLNQWADYQMAKPFGKQQLQAILAKLIGVK